MKYPILFSFIILSQSIIYGQGTPGTAMNDLHFAEDYFRKDSIQPALLGDGKHPGFLSIIQTYPGTDAANLSNFYAGVCYIKSGNNPKAIDHLLLFRTNTKPIQQKAYKLLGDAYADNKQFENALTYYKKAAYVDEE